MSVVTPTRDIRRLRARRHPEPGRRDHLRVDIGLGLVAAVAALLLTPGLGIVAVMALLVIVLCVTSLVLGRWRSRRRMRR